MWPMLIVVRLVVVQDPPQMGLVPDEGAVQEFASASVDPVGLDYSIAACWVGVSWPFWRLASSLRDLLGRLPARALPAQLPDAAGPAW
ncbi:MAG TPA: hypothetical protein VNO54_29145, partial [Streptosporangiaceae bacterium]|nr:hypothetical protein [Streptosporangiaceae bacterium]